MPTRRPFSDRDEAALPDGVRAAELRDSIATFVREHPIRALGFGSGVGFVLGGGLRTSLGRAGLAVVVRMAARAMIGNLVTGALLNGMNGRHNGGAGGRARADRKGSADEVVGC
jgi:hypothetical protein